MEEGQRFAEAILRCLKSGEMETLHEGSLRLYRERLNWQAWAERFRQIMEANGL